MNGYAEIAELIYTRVRRRNGFVLDNLKDLDLLLSELKRIIIKTNLKFRYEFNNIEDLLEQISLSNRRKLDLTIIPNRFEDKEFILWFAVIIENITEIIIYDPPRGKFKRPIMSEEDNGEDIQAYLSSKNFKRY
ncbi:hypothetical protein E0H88_12835 [Acinetobacter sp. ANC 4216]|uniref:hypothetical protein n=1 Tax=Acinetobacter sp. ANC 4216 TaxID=2529840 RepID=UPI00103C80A8|nr:hypothetical protein [Acinetobacter sp. ANC 4216]TCB67407.1 hypothetical protein E0H88_12835 [Acinetobacter sp. ANC 4216]